MKYLVRLSIKKTCVYEVEATSQEEAEELGRKKYNRQATATEEEEEDIYSLVATKQTR